jgi:hypothetical protein
MTLETAAMKMTRLVLVGLAVAGLAACDGGGIDLNVATTDNSCQGDGACQTNNTGGGGNNPCASYTVPNSDEVRQGAFDGANCIYDSNLVGETNPLLTDLTIPFISGKHIFQDSLFVGQNVDSGVAPAGGTGPTLTIAPGNTLVWQDAGDYLLVNRGSQIIANGTPSAPITLTSFTDAIQNAAGANDVQQWGGVVINGNGITNNCTDEERANNQCHVTAEGKPSNYGGNDNAESSGSLRYVVVKHSGFAVVEGDELNGITFNAVGSGTVVENVEVYSTYDDGMEFFGGAVSPKNVVILYARDDSLDYSDGYVGTIENALIIHWRTDGNRCIEGDNVGSSRTGAGVPFDLAPIATPTIRNMTCIVSGFDEANGGTHGDSEGPLVRQGGKLMLENSIVYGGYADVVNGSSNECFEIDDDDNVSRSFAQNGDDFYVKDTVIACAEPAKDSLPNGDTILNWLTNTSTVGANYAFNTGNVVIDQPLAGPVRVLQSNSYFTAPAIVDAAGNTVVADASGLGAVQSGNDWTSPWAFGLRASNADEPLWFQ